MKNKQKAKKKKKKKTDDASMFFHANQMLLYKADTFVFWPTPLKTMYYT